VGKGLTGATAWRTNYISDGELAAEFGDVGDDVARRMDDTLRDFEEVFTFCVRSSGSLAIAGGRRLVTDQLIRAPPRHPREVRQAQDEDSGEERHVDEQI
jgi:hypothetical protein